MVTLQQYLDYTVEQLKASPRQRNVQYVALSVREIENAVSSHDDELTAKHSCDFEEDLTGKPHQVVQCCQKFYVVSI